MQYAEIAHITIWKKLDYLGSRTAAFLIYTHHGEQGFEGFCLILLGIICFKNTI